MRRLPAENSLITFSPKERARNGKPLLNLCSGPASFAEDDLELRNCTLPLRQAVSSYPPSEESIADAKEYADRVYDDIKKYTSLNRQNASSALTNQEHEQRMYAFLQAASTRMELFHSV